MPTVGNAQLPKDDDRLPPAQRVLVAKFRAAPVGQSRNEDGTPRSEQVTLNAVSGPENEPWSSLTPVGKVYLEITGQGAFGIVEENCEYMVTIQKIEKDSRRR